MSVLRTASEIAVVPVAPSAAAPKPAQHFTPTPFRATFSAQTMRVEFITAPEKWADYFQAWEELAAATIEPNVFYEPWMLLPAVSRFGAGKKLGLALVFAPDPTCDHGQPTLCGVFPLELQNRYHGLHQSLPVKTLSFWKHPYCYLCTPLLRRECASQTLQAFFNWLESGEHGCALMEFNLMAGDGPFHHLLTDYFYKTVRLTVTSECHTRALFQRAADADTYLEAALSGKRQRDLKRQRKQLSEIGQIEYAALAQGDELALWIEEFLKLEALSWKGKENYALTSQAADRDYFEQIAAEAFQRGKLMMLALRLDGRPIACKCNFLAGSGSFAFKIAYDDDYARYSPGKLLEVENIRLLHDDPDIAWMDSCADPVHPMLDLMWPARRTIQTVTVGTGKAPGDLVVSLVPMLKWLNRKLRRRNVTRTLPTTARWNGGER